MAEHVDIAIIGAGLAGIGVAYHVQEKLPGKSFALFEARDRIGGTWDIFKYPGLRSDVDMHLYGYSFAPWTRESGVASASNIMAYLNETLDAFDLRRHIRFGHELGRAEWDSGTALWTLHFADGREVTCRWLQMCAGYYHYDSGYRPEFPGEADFEGEIIHPQEWDECTSVAGKRVVVIGSGATAVTILPELVKDAAHVTQLQRSPTYVFAGPKEPKLTKLLRTVLPQPAAYHAVRKKDLFFDKVRHNLVHSKPDKLKQMIRDAAKEHLPEGYDFETHFQPDYAPGKQRMCFAPDGDFYQAVAKDNCEVVTDRIRTFTEAGIELESGRHLDADVVITATGLRMRMFEPGTLVVDGKPITASETWLYKGILLSGVPNFSLTVGSLVHSYTLRVELIARFVCRVLAHMESKGLAIATPTLPKPVEEMESRPFTEDFNSGYVLRAIPDFPRTTSESPWINQQPYHESVREFTAPLEDGHLRFSAPVGSRNAA